MSWQYILFDLDGTLTDPEEGITKAVAFALARQGIDIPDRSVLRPFIGPPLRRSFMNRYGFSAEQAEQAVADYREYFGQTGIFENKIYDGIPELLGKLKEAGKSVALATCKPHPYAKRILDHFEITPYFDLIAGSEFDGTRGEKAEVVGYALERLAIQNLSQAVMIGDREDDMNGAKANQIYAVGVLYGYGPRKELETAGADIVVEDVTELAEILL
ncbi:MAG: HAD family hydrolase [Oscillospiraceae bacterium]|nr:HAD family hydrolase [Oscillospiraceae bacterium]